MKILESGFDESLKKMKDIGLTEKGHLFKEYTGETRTIKTRFFGRIKKQEAYKIHRQIFDTWSCKFVMLCSDRIYWEDKIEKSTM